MLVTTRRHLAASLAAYGEGEASARIAGMSQSQFQRVCEIGFQHALSGSALDEASCLAAVEVLEGRPRPLRRRRRVWSDVPAGLLGPDPELSWVAQVVPRPSGKQSVDRREILTACSAALAPGLPGFRYFKSYSQFRETFAQGTSYITLECAYGLLELRFGVTHADVERLRQQMFPEATGPSVFLPRTILKYTPNMGPTSPHWPYPMDPAWQISASPDLARACSEVVAFVQDVALPYVLDHRDPRCIRETLLHHPGEADVWNDAQTVFAIDRLLDERAWFEADCIHFRSRYAQFDESAPIRRALERDYRAALEYWNAAP